MTKKIRIKIEDIDETKKISPAELEKISGGGFDPGTFRPNLKLGPGGTRSYIMWGAKDWEIIKQ